MEKFLISAGSVAAGVTTAACSGVRIGDTDAFRTGAAGRAEHTGAVSHAAARVGATEAGYGPVASEMTG
ncbi:hypothetical protein CHIBA101_1032 [Actinomyces sp. Chiba101]|nr:hypothetical protein CHIBA101_1032 [Actinomyces sp. Chiba101]GAV94122.1 hypothetical protein ADENT20671_0890 [Actinomyces denticolens]